jgi:hypothetical protein
LPLLDEETRKAALQRTRETLKGLVEISRDLDLPATSLPQVMEIYAASARDVVIESERADAAARSLRLPMEVRSLGSDYRPLCVRPGEVYEVIARPQWIAYQVEDIEIDGDPARWRVHDIKVGFQSQVAGTVTPIPGERFRKGGIMSELRLATCQTAMNFVLAVEYVGPLAEGEVFEATLVGLAAT